MVRSPIGAAAQYVPVAAPRHCPRRRPGGAVINERRCAAHAAPRQRTAAPRPPSHVGSALPYDLTFGSSRPMTTKPARRSELADAEFLLGRLAEALRQRGYQGCVRGATMAIRKPHGGEHVITCSRGKFRSDGWPIGSVTEVEAVADLIDRKLTNHRLGRSR